MRELYHIGLEQGSQRKTLKRLSEASKDHGRRIKRIEIYLWLAARSLFLVGLWILSATGKLKSSDIIDFGTGLLRKLLIGV